jgi:hypothetical protein
LTDIDKHAILYQRFAVSIPPSRSISTHDILPFSKSSAILALDGVHSNTKAFEVTFDYAILIAAKKVFQKIHFQNVLVSLGNLLWR